MEKDHKFIFLVSVFFTSLGICLHLYQIWVSFLFALALIAISFYTHSRISLIGLILYIAFLFPFSSPAGLYGRDAHSAARIAQRISDSGHLVPFNFPLGDPTTPLLHIYTALVNIVTKINISPYTNDDAILPQFLPIIFVLLTLLFVHIVAKASYTKYNYLYLLPIYSFIPYYQFYTGFRRASIAFLFAVMFIYTLIKFTKTKNHKYFYLAIISMFSTYLSHVGVPLYLLILTTSIYLIDKTVLILNIDRVRVREGVSSLLFFISIVLGFLIMIQNTVFTRVTMLPILLYSRPEAENIEGVLLSGADNTSVSFLQYINSTSSLYLVMIIGFVFTVVVIWKAYDESVSTIELGFYVLAVTLGVLTIITYYGPTFITHSRTISAFIIIAAWIPLVIIGRTARRRWGLELKFTMVTLLLVILSLSSLDPAIISNQSSVTYEGGGGNIGQSFNDLDYTMANFIYNYGNEGPIIGDSNVNEVVYPRTELKVSGNPYPILNGTIPSDSYLVLADRNEVVFKSQYRRNKIVLSPPQPPSSILDSSNQRIYTNGNYHVWKSVSR